MFDVKFNVWPAHSGLLLLTTGVEGTAMMLTVMGARALSHPLTVWLTHQVKVPAVAVLGIGAVELPVPPVCVVYHNRF
jgi:hypothetical protein